ncbi:MAG: hypothetical protein QXH42_02455 [Thermoplasmata archaeon]
MVEARIFLEPLPDRLRAFMGRRGRVFFEVRSEPWAGAGSMETLRMHEPGGRVLGTVTYELASEGRVRVHALHIDDWSRRGRYPARLLRRFVESMRERGMVSIEGSLYGLSASGHDLMMLLKEVGFEFMEMGTLTGRSEYSIKLRLE